MRAAPQLTIRLLICGLTIRNTGHRRLSFIYTAVLAVVIDDPDDQRMHVGAAVWIGLGAAVFIIGGVLLMRRKTTDGFGAVSDQWVMQHRATPPEDGG